MKIDDKIIDAFFHDLWKELEEYPHMRYGQCVYRVMSNYFPETAKKLICTELDCYYDDTKSSVFIEKCFFGDLDEDNLR